MITGSRFRIWIDLTLNAFKKIRLQAGFQATMSCPQDRILHLNVLWLNWRHLSQKYFLLPTKNEAR